MAKIVRPLIFALIVIALVVVLKILGWLPLAINKDSIRAYHSIDEMAAAIRPQKLYMPSYFPQYLMWPPVKIYAGKNPQAILMLFAHKKTGDIVLSISQGTGVESLIEPQRVLSTERTSIKGRQATIYTALCADGEPCNKVVVVDRETPITIIVKDPVSEAIKTAESIFSAEP